MANQSYNRTQGSIRRPLTEQALRAVLDRDNAKGAIVADRGGKISRRHYASLLGCSRSALTRYKTLLADYERGLGIATGPMRNFQEMRNWLTTKFEARELGFRDGRLDRLGFQMRFGLRGGSFFTRHPPIRELLQEFDARARQEGYLPRARQAEFNRVSAALFGQPALNKDLLKIDRNALAKASNVPKSRFKQKAFADAIVAKETTIAAQALSSKINPYAHGRVFAFDSLTGIWPEPFIERVAVRFKHVAAGLAQSSVKQPYLELIAALDWIGKSKNPHCRAVVAEADELGRVASSDEWEDALFAYRDHLVASIASGSVTESAVDSSITALRTSFSGLASGRVTPDKAMPLPGIKHVRRRGGHLKSVAETTAVSGSGAKADFVAFAKDRYLEICRNSGTDMGQGDSDNFVNGLAVELGTSHDLPDDPVLAVRLVLERRLDALRSHATAIVDAAAKELERGRELLSLSDIDGEAFEAAYMDSERNQYNRQQLTRTFFPIAETSIDGKSGRGLANLLALIRQRHAGVPPSGHAKKETRAYGQFFAKRYLEYGGLTRIAQLLGPDSNAVAATLTLYLIESGANVSVGRTLDRECMQESDLDGHCRITGYKARAKGKPIIVDLPETSPAIRAMKWLISASEEMKSASSSDSTRLFLVRIRGRAYLIPPHFYTNWFRGFAASTPRLHGLKLIPSMIRPSVLLHAALSNDGRLAVGRAIAQHGLVVSQGYQQKWPTRLLYESNVRRFQTAFETIIVSNVEGAASKLGITVAQFEARIGDLRETGLGTFCRDDRGRSSEPGKKCLTLDCWNDCPHTLIVAEVEAIATLQLWQRTLRAAQPSWERDHPERWNEVWLPWLCLTEVVEEKMVRGPLIKIWNAAAKRADEMSAQQGYAPPRPW
jgi:hypothetical protein